MEDLAETSLSVLIESQGLQTNVLTHKGFS